MAKPLLLVLLSIFVLSSAPRAEAVEYRLRVVNLLEEAFARFIDPGRLVSAEDDRLDRLESALDQGRMPAGVVLYDRALVPATTATARAFAASVATPLAAPAPVDGRAWTEVAWEGKPGERSLWIIEGAGIHYQEVRHAGLRGVAGVVRHFLPFGAPLRPSRLRVMATSVEFLDFWSDREDFWRAWLASRVDLADGIAAVVGRTARLRPDRVYVLIEHAPAPTTYTAIFAWRQYRHQPLDAGSDGRNAR